MCPAAARVVDFKVLDDPYESFMRYHLQHYGYYTDRRSTHSGPMREQSWQRDGSPTPNQNLPESNNSSSTASEEEPQRVNYSFLNEYQLLRTRQLVFDYHAGRHVPRLREPRNLYPVAAGSPIQPPRWPIECEVIREKMHHIEWTPPEPERLYQPSQQEHMPTCLGDEGKNTVFVIDAASKGSYFTFSRVGGRRGPVRLATVGTSGKDSSTLIFESRFESGNLQKATRVDTYEYELTLRTDLYTDKHTQWYYFRVQNMRPGVSYRFTIVNLMKRTSLYSQGLRPLLYSEREAQLRGVGWHRAGGDIRYYRNNLSSPEGRSLYSLTWTCLFPHGDDTCFFAHSYPYTYSSLQRYLSAVAGDPVRSRYCRLRVLCRSLAGNLVHLLTITSPGGRQDARPAKRAVVVTARVHPGETNGSWVMMGFLDHLLGPSDDAQLLRDTFIFKVVPMLNPDGVVVGNYRCSLAGRDLNRNYGTVLRDCFPSVWHTRNMVQRLMEEREVVIYCDFHGHSRKNNAFMYGCSGNQLPVQPLGERVFPLMMSKNAADKFSYQSCKFKVQKSKAGTGRVVMWKMGIAHSYTMETTFAGSTLGNRKATHFSTEDLKSLGYHFCDTLLDFCDPDHSKFEQCLAEVRAALQKEVRQRLERLGREYNSDVTLSDLTISDLESSTSGSNSTESDGPPAHLMRLAAKVHQKKKRLRSRKERNRLRQRHLLARPSPPDPLRHPAASGKKRSEEIECPVNFERAGRAKTIMAKVQLQHTHRDQVLKPRPWIPNTTSGLSVICSVDTKSKTAWLEAMSTAYLRRQHNATPGQKYEKFVWDNGEPSPVTSQQRAVCQRHALPVSIVDQQSWDPPQQSSTPIKLHPLPFDAELLCTDTLRQCLSDYSWKPGGLPLRRIPSATLNRPLSTYSAPGPRTPVTNRQLASKSATPHLEEPRPPAPLEGLSPAADGLIARPDTKVRPKPVTAAESGSPSEWRTTSTRSSSVGLELTDEPSVGRAESATAEDHLHIGETTSLPPGNEEQEMAMGTEVSSRKNIVSKSPKMAQSSSGSRVHGSERGKRAPPVTLSMATASLVSLDTVPEQDEDVNNIEDGLYKLTAPFEPYPSALQASDPEVNRKKIKAQGLPRLKTRANRLSLPNGVSGTPVAMHQTGRGPLGTRQPSDPAAAEDTDGPGQVLSRRSPEPQDKDPGCKRLQKVERNSLAETLGDQLSVVGLRQENRQQTRPAESPSTGAAT
ncbi:cytosolic carboxypeptidase 2-like [Pristis pectinata]|uniref:cytosolic carboxypeptidase 2-like n=1 Tax=Pristis pectinata TaxID=685728 RepID=UPI00223D7DFA|nr:cytosolic carboxypeptidase 2-like [Pristis pectinata]